MARRYRNILRLFSFATLLCSLVFCEALDPRAPAPQALNVSLFVENQMEVSIGEVVEAQFQTSLLLTSNPPSKAATITPSPVATRTTSAPNSHCPSSDVCWIFYQNVNLYYWPQQQANSACLAGKGNPPSQTLPPGLSVHSPSVYVVFQSITANDACSNRVGPTFSGLTTSFNPDQLSTILPDGTQQSYNYGDLPCPPPGKNTNPASPYAPQVAFPTSFFANLNPAFSNCQPGAGQGIDPPTACPPSDGPSDPGTGLHPRQMHQKRAPGHPRAVARAPAETGQAI